jgi:cyclohexanecarboxyl-CoA dehydrogenase
MQNSERYFQQSDEQRMIIERVGTFAGNEMKPLARYFDDYGNTKEGQQKFRELRKKAASLGILGLGIPEEYGGIKASAITLGLVCEEIGRKGVSFMLMEPPVIFSAIPILHWGTEEQKKRYLSRLVNGDLSSFGLYVTEPGAGSEVTAISTRAVRSGDEYVLNGEKMFVSGSQWDEVAVIACKTKEESGHRGISLIVVDLNVEGVERIKLRTMGWHNLELGGIALHDVRVPAENLVGKENDGFYYLMKAFEGERVFHSCGAVGIAEGSLGETIEYVKQRKQFGRPIGKFEAVQFRIAEAATQLEAAKWFCHRTLWLMDHGVTVRKESAMLKWWVNEVAYKSVNDMILNKGAYGYTLDCLDDIRLRELKGGAIAGGTGDIQKIIIGRELLGKEFDPLS